MSTALSGPTALLGVDPATYTVHRLHSEERAYRETNCYTDVLVELLHAHGREPLAVLACVLRTDFEGDQFSFFKPASADLEGLLGVDIHEMQPHRPAPVQLAEQLAAGRTMIIELDSFYLPDTHATAYRQAHVKSSVAVDAIDAAGERLVYFHNAGLYELSGEDFRGVFRVDHPVDAEVLPPYTELARFDLATRLEGDELRSAAAAATARHLALAPRDNPFVRFGAQLGEDLPALLAGDAEDFHAYAFATVRMAGAAFEIAGTLTRWLRLDERGEEAAAGFDAIVAGCKVLSFRLARRRAFDPAERVAELAGAWERATNALADALP